MCLNSPKQFGRGRVTWRYTISAVARAWVDFRIQLSSLSREYYGPRDAIRCVYLEQANESVGKYNSRFKVVWFRNLGSCFLKTRKKKKKKERIEIVSKKMERRILPDGRTDLQKHHVLDNFIVLSDHDRRGRVLHWRVIVQYHT